MIPVKVRQQHMHGSAAAAELVVEGATKRAYSGATVDYQDVAA